MLCLKPHFPSSHTVKYGSVALPGRAVVGSWLRWEAYSLLPFHFLFLLSRTQIPWLELQQPICYLETKRASATNLLLWNQMAWAHNVRIEEGGSCFHWKWYPAPIPEWCPKLLPYHQSSPPFQLCACEWALTLFYIELSNSFQGLKPCAKGLLSHFCHPLMRMD